MSLTARITILPKQTILDPQGAAVKMALDRLDFQGVDLVRQGKLIEIKLATTDKAEAVSEAEKMCTQLLANTIMETYTIEIL